MKNEEDKRWDRYRIANASFPHTRIIELTKQLEYTHPKKGETIVEVGTGNGILTIELAKRVDGEGKIITYDYQKVNVENIKKTKGNLPIAAFHQDSYYGLNLPNESVDKVSTLASLHHYDNYKEKTGFRGRKKIISEFYKILKKGGLLVIGDVADKTPSQRYFYAIDNPIHCYPSGHPHDFPDEEKIVALCKEIGFKNIKFKVEQVPWQFENEKKAALFLNKLHNAKCSPEESLNIAKKYLSHWHEKGIFYLEWQLFYLTAEK